MREKRKRKEKIGIMDEDIERKEWRCTNHKAPKPMAIVFNMSIEVPRANM